MASSSPNQTTTVSYTFPTPIKLDRSNYLIWKMQVLASIQGNGLEGYIDGSITTPYTDQRIPSSEFVIWKRIDQQLLGWLLSSMTESVLGIVLGCKTFWLTKQNQSIATEESNDVDKEKRFECL
ncbi:hypothetical protein AB3S75_037563 [Citrus x aurantiifolia]